MAALQSGINIANKDLKLKSGHLGVTSSPGCRHLGVPTVKSLSRELWLSTHFRTEQESEGGGGLLMSITPIGSSLSI